MVTIFTKRNLPTPVIIVKISGLFWLVLVKKKLLNQHAQIIININSKTDLQNILYFFL